MSSKSDPTPAAKTPLTTEQQAACKHPAWKIVNTSGPSADGLGECVTFDGRCTTCCDKVLVKRYECISANWCEVMDEEWARRPDIKPWLDKEMMS